MRRHAPYAMALVAILLTSLPALAVASPPGQAPESGLDPRRIPQFVEPLPIPAIVDGTQPLTLRMCEFRSRLLPAGATGDGRIPETWVWGYRTDACPSTTQDTYLGPIIVARRGIPTQVTYLNELGSAAMTHVAAYAESVDQTLHWADPSGEAAGCANDPPPQPRAECRDPYLGAIPAVAHLHGGEVPAQVDGGPDAWFTSDGSAHGHAYYTRAGVAVPANGAVYTYPNTQPSAPLWFHDHTLGATRLNVYAGLAGGYLLTDPATDPRDLPPITPLIIQDRRFTVDGQLLFPAGRPDSPNPEHPRWVPEFVGDTIAVNGRVWPYMEVQARRYRFVLVNGSNARAYELSLHGPTKDALAPALWQIGTDGGYLDAPVRLSPDERDSRLRRLLLMPGERADIVIDFAGIPAGSRLVLRNTAAMPYPSGDAVDPATTGRVLQFRVNASASADTTLDIAADGVRLRGGQGEGPAIVRLAAAGVPELAPGIDVALHRALTLNEVIRPAQRIGQRRFAGGPLEVLLNNTEWHGTARADFTPVSYGEDVSYYSEFPTEGTTEVWDLINLTADAHPIHLHLAQVQIVSRQRLDTEGYLKAYQRSFRAANPGVEGSDTEGQGPPLDVTTPNRDGAVGGNPAVTRFLRGKPLAPAANEAGWKDTVSVPPGEVTRIVVRWAPTDLPATTPVAQAVYPFSPDGGHGYVWHCHIIDHEDNEMMRPFAVIANASASRSIPADDGATGH